MQGRLKLGRPGATIFSALVACVVIGILVLSGILLYALPRWIEYVMGEAAVNPAIGRYRHVLETIDLPAREELKRYLAAENRRASEAAEIIGEFQSSTAKDNLVIALREPDGSLALVLPRQDSPLRALAETIFALGMDTRLTSLEKIGDRVFRRFASRDVREIEALLGLERGRLFAGILVTYGELASRAPRNFGPWGSELTVFRSGVSILHYRWNEDEVKVEQGSGGIPMDVLNAGTGTDAPRLPDFFHAPERTGTFRREFRDGQPYGITYWGAAGTGGWSGFVFAAPEGRMELILSAYGHVLAAAGALGSLGIVLFGIWCLHAGRRLTRASGP
ncbi:MAG: hypothetical protein HYY48_06360 [Gammaproteobacteria bacterium]|nr:hypothetical protein [Gammaproteobacteria bacterium]